MIYESRDGGELNLKNEDIQAISGITNQVYLALWGGNLEQITSDDLAELDQRFDWWGNDLMTPELQFNSYTEKVINETVLNSHGISIIEDAVKKDLQFLDAYADIKVEASMRTVSWLDLKIFLKHPDVLSTKKKFLWEGTEEEFVIEPSGDTPLKGIGVMIIESTFIVT